MSASPAATVRIARRLVDERFGIIASLYEAPCDAGAPQIFGFGSILADSTAYGFAHSGRVNGSTSPCQERAAAGAIGEAVERYSGAYVPYDDLLYAPYASLGEDAIDPRALVLYDDERYAASSFLYERFDERRVLAWVRGHSLTRRRDVLVPAFAAYIPFERRHGEQALSQLVTTGLACGNTVAAATYAGLTEVVERDGAMLAWLRGTPLPAVNASSATDPALIEVLRRFAPVQDRVRLLDATTDLGVPVVLAAYRDESGRVPAAVIASNADLDPQRAALGALNELAQCMTWVGSMVDAGKTHALPAFDRFTEIEHHVLWPALPEHADRLAFLFASAERRDVRALGVSGRHDEPLGACVERLARRGLEAIAVEVTSPDVAELGLHVVRVIIPGAQPLFFGSDLPRISARARVAGMRLNLDPHPYP
ncbi:MAG: ribosomal protein methylthiotransferase accessory factor [Candidatus Eremiobacteraeota bacterium]|jgi:ribosomal protein S12 methylthiotransferase accessory factor|nr:ribosomal protein methylthiotransferase accessory factor [Candidatus Eremiobacteraeota bacterium]